MEFIEIAPGCPYYGWATSIDMTCEEGLCSWIRQPANVISSIALFFPAYFILLDSWKHKINQLWPIGIAAGLIGFASVSAHATHMKLFGFADFTFQYLFSLVLIWLNLKRLNPNFSFDHWPFALTFWAPTAVLQWNYPQWSIPVYLLLVLLILVTEFMNSKRDKTIQYKNYFLCAWMLGVGLVLFMLDYTGLVCDPHNHYFQLHALWHIFSAISIVYLGRFYRQFGIFNR